MIDALNLKQTEKDALSVKIYLQLEVFQRGAGAHSFQKMISDT